MLVASGSLPSSGHSSFKCKNVWIVMKIKWNKELNNYLIINNHLKMSTVF